jgi:hypothetical protein
MRPCAACPPRTRNGHLPDAETGPALADFDARRCGGWRVQQWGGQAEARHSPNENSFADLEKVVLHCRETDYDRW